MQVAEVIGAKLPANFRVPCQGPGSRAWRVHQNAVEPAFEGQRLRAVKHERLHISNACGFESLRHGPHAVRMQVRGGHASLRPGCARQENRFSAWSSAEVEDRVSRLDA